MTDCKESYPNQQPSIKLKLFAETILHELGKPKKTIAINQLTLEGVFFLKKAQPESSHHKNQILTLKQKLLEYDNMSNSANRGTHSPSFTNSNKTKRSNNLYRLSITIVRQHCCVLRQKRAKRNKRQNTTT